MGCVLMLQEHQLRAAHVETKDELYRMDQWPFKSLGENMLQLKQPVREVSPTKKG